MRLSGIPLFRVFGISLELHWTFLLLLAFYGWDGYQDTGLIGMLTSTFAVILVFSCVLCHELGHCLIARHYGVRIIRILMMPIGGMAEFATLPKTPKQELLVTLAGPAVNFVFVLVIGTIIGFSGQQGWLRFSPMGFTQLLGFIFIVNLFMGTFNLLPIFPMDGGRILRATLALWLDYLKATRVAVNVGKFLAITGIGVAIFWMHDWVLAILFLFIFMSGEQEYQAVSERAQWEKAMREAMTPSQPSKWPYNNK